jgi:methionyl-tRNA synthetase
MPESFYITTAIDYANGAPHLGHAYEKVLADVLARHARMSGRKVHFLTGLDEHGQKVQQTALKRGVTPQQLVDEVAVGFREMLSELGISHDDYIRTTEPRHRKVVQEFLSKLHADGLIFKDTKSGWYSVRQEQFLSDKDRDENGAWPEIYGEVTQTTEENYYFRLSQFQPWLVEHIRSHPDFILPRFRQNQVLEFLKEPMNDLCISRPKSRLTWGIELPFDKEFVTYVWFDALTNYYSAVADKGLWPADVHVIGKDILSPPHAVYWPCMLRAMGIEAPRRLLVHGWWTIDKKKASKSAGNATDSLSFARSHGKDAFRYYLCREMVVGQDADFSEASFNGRYKADLGNSLGNLVNRLLNMSAAARASCPPRPRTRTLNAPCARSGPMPVGLTTRPLRSIRSAAPWKASGPSSTRSTPTLRRALPGSWPSRPSPPTEPVSTRASRTSPKDCVSSGPRCSRSCRTPQPPCSGTSDSPSLRISAHSTGRSREAA